MLEPRLILVNLLIKLGVAAALSSALVRSKEFKSLIFREQRETRHKIYLALWMAIPIALGVWIRYSVKSFLAGDLSLETALLLGVIGWRLSGGVGGALLSLPELSPGGCGVSRPNRKISGRSRRSLISASTAGFAAICRGRAYSIGRSLFL